MELHGLGILGLDEPPEPSRIIASTPAERRASRAAAAAADDRARFAGAPPALGTFRTGGTIAWFEDEDASSSDDSSAISDDDEEMTSPPAEGGVADDEDDEDDEDNETTEDNETIDEDETIQGDEEIEGLEEIENYGEIEDYEQMEDDGEGEEDEGDEENERQDGDAAIEHDDEGEDGASAGTLSDELLQVLEETDVAAQADANEEMETNEVGEGQDENTDAARAVASSGILPKDAILIKSLKVTDEIILKVADKLIKRQRLGRIKAGEGRLPNKIDFFTSLAQYPELIIAVALTLPIDDFVSLYAISKGFNESINGFLTFVMRTYAAIRAPETSSVFVFNLYGGLCKVDPVGRPDPTYPGLTRLVPSFPWLRMVLHRHKTVRDILALMAIEGFRMPKTMSLSLKKMWLTMDIATSARRAQLMHNKTYWTNSDLYNIQMFVMKLDMRLNDPIDGPGDDGLRKLMLGQRGLTPLCKLLKREKYTDLMEVFEAAVRYCYRPDPADGCLPIFGVPFIEIGKGHLEGWGKGKIHLYRIEELVMRESVRRNLKLADHLVNMMLWGYVDAKTRMNIEVTEEEKYMSDEEEKVEVESSDEEGTTDQQMNEAFGEEGQEGLEDQEMMDAETDDEY